MFLKNTFWGVFGDFFSRSAKLLLVMLIARTLGVEDMGRFNYSLALAGLFSVLFDFGVLPVVVKELAQRPDGNSLQLYGIIKLCSSVTGILCVALASFISGLSRGDQIIIVWLGVYLALNDLSIYVSAAYRARLEFWRETVLRAAISAIQLIGCIAALLIWRDLLSVVVGLVCCTAIGVIPLCIELSKRSARSNEKFCWSSILVGIRQCLPIAGTVLVGTVYMNFDIVILGHYASMSDVAAYSVAVKTVFALLTMPVQYLQLATLPDFAIQIRSGSVDAVRDRWFKSFMVTATGGALFSFLTALLAPELLMILFGREFSSAAPVLVVFTALGFMFYLYTPMSQWLLLIGRQGLTFAIQITAMLVNMLLVIVLVPRLSMWGAVLAAVVTHLAIAVGHFVVVIRSGGIKLAQRESLRLLRIAGALTFGLAIIWLGQSGLTWRMVAVVVFWLVMRAELTELLRLLKSAFVNWQGRNRTGKAHLSDINQRK